MAGVDTEFRTFSVAPTLTWLLHGVLRSLNSLVSTP